MRLTANEKLRSFFEGPIIPGIVAAFTALVIFTVPAFPYIVDDALSEKRVLNFAHEQGWQFGKDIIFTYGPLGFLASRYYFPHAATLRFFVDISLATVVSVGLVLLAWRMTKWWRVVTLLTFLFLIPNIDPRYDLLLYCGLFCWALLILISVGRTLALSVIAFSLLAAFSTLVKSNFLIVAAMIALGLLADLVLRREKRCALLLCGLIVVFSLAGWGAAGQSFKNLASFFSNIFTIAKGYNAAVGLNGLEVLRTRGALALVLALFNVGLAATAWFPGPTGVESKTVNRWHLARRTVAGLWMMALVFLVWKHGFVRGDMFHMGFFFGFCPVCVLLLASVPSAPSTLARIARVCGLLSWAVVLFTLQTWCFPALPGSLYQPLLQANYSSKTLLHPRAFASSMSAQMKTNLSKLELPGARAAVGEASVDVFGQDQIYALYNGLTYRPRPVFQSYMAYNRHLDRLNESFYLSPRAPDYVLFQLTPIDHRFAPLEDAFVLRDLLLNYQAVLEENPVLLLKRKSIHAPQLTLLRKQTAQPGEPVDLTVFGTTNLWLEIDLEPTFSGVIRSAVFKPAPTRLAVRTDITRAYKAPAPMLAAGFVASPLLLSQSDVAAFYAARDSAASNKNENAELSRPKAISVQFDRGTEKLWQNEIVYRLYSF